ncbi:cardiolipin synthase ClsB [Imbroritus primus]
MPMRSPLKRPIRALRRAWRRNRAVAGNRVDLLCCGEFYFPALCEAIDAATRSVRMETYIYTHDASGECVTRALVEAARRGVEVYVVVDGIGTGEPPPEVISAFREAGVHYRVFRPVRWWVPRRRYLRRLHRKLAVIDDRLGFVGGINIIDDLNHAPLQDSGYGPRYDFAVRVEGPIVAQIVETMRVLWTRFSGAGRVERAPAPPSGSGAHAVAATDAQPEVAAGTLSTHEGVRAALVLRDNVRNRRAIEREYLVALGNARHDVIIANAYFLPGLRFRRALLACRRRGVRVRLLLQGQVEYRLQHHATQALYGQLLNAGVEIYEYTDSFLHAKVAVVDQVWATVGSSNIDPFSLLLAREANLVVWDDAFSASLRDALELAMTARSVAVERELHDRRPRWRRALDWLAYGLVSAGVMISGHAGRY